MIRRKLNESASNSFKRLVEDYNKKDWNISNKENTTFYRFLFEDVKSAKEIYIPYTLSGYGNEFFDEVLFEDGSTHFFWNKGGFVGGDENTKLLVEEVKFSNEALKEIEYFA